MPSSTYHRVGRSEGAEGEGEGGAEHCDVVGLWVCALSAAGDGGLKLLLPRPADQSVRGTAVCGARIAARRQRRWEIYIVEVTRNLSWQDVVLIDGAVNFAPCLQWIVVPIGEKPDGTS